jgi:CheY-like chemotaxis protein
MNDKHAIRVLIADDDAPMRSLLSSLLRTCGYLNVEQAGDGQQALDRLRDTAAPVDLAFLDIEMPGFTGIELLTMLPDGAARPFCVVVSAHSGLENVLAVLNAGARGFIVKPYSPRKISDMLAKFEAERL